MEGCSRVLVLRDVPNELMLVTPLSDEGRVNNFLPKVAKCREYKTGNYQDTILLTKC